MSTASQPFAYDAVAYPTAVLAVLTPDRVRAAGILHGWNAPRADTATVLEIGCGDGLNLIGMAAIAPNARFIGFDLSSSAIARGRDLVAAAGLENVDLHEGNILDYSRHGVMCDYILANGVYAWTPPPVRAALLDLIAARLAPGGVAFCSYDCLPAAASKLALNTFLNRYAPPSLPFEQRLREALRLIALAARHQAPSSRLKPQIDNLVTSLPNFDPGYLFHDFLAEHYHPASLAEFAAAAAGRGLDVAGDAGLGDLSLVDLDDEAKSMVEAAPDWVSRGHLIDVLRGSTMFRRSLLVRREAPPLPTDSLDDLSFACAATRLETESGIRFEAGDAAATIAPGMAEIAVLDALIAAYPVDLSLGDILSRTSLDPIAAEVALRAVVAWQLADAHTTPPPFVAAPGDRPTAGPLIRAMMARGDTAITLRHVQMVTDQTPTRVFLHLCDGTRTRADLARDMAARLGGDITEGIIDAAIADLARRRLFVA